MSFGENKDEEHDPQFAPVHQLTDKDQIETKTFEEDEDSQFKMRAKLFRFDGDASEWKERGTGDVRILAHRESKKVRLVMRRDKTLKVCANHYITADMRLQPNIGSDRSWVWKVAADVSEGAATSETLAIRFANSENAGLFKTAFESAQKQNADLAAGAVPGEPIPSAIEPEVAVKESAADTDAAPVAEADSEEPTNDTEDPETHAATAKNETNEGEPSTGAPQTDATETAKAEALVAEHPTPAAEHTTTIDTTTTELEDTLDSSAKKNDDDTDEAAEAVGGLNLEDNAKKDD